jgi:hypothetical protein
MATRTVLRSTIIFVATLLLSASADAQLFRTYLAPTGVDTNPCTLPAPCRLLPAALAAVADGGEIWMLDSANYNTTTVNITKSVSILATPGALGSVVANGFDAISINAPSSKIKLRNLTMRSLLGSGGGGISVVAAGNLLIENVTLENLGTALYLTGTAVINIKDSLFRSNNGAIVIAQTGGAQEVVSIDNTSFVDNPQSIIATTNSTTGFLRLTVDNSVVTGTTGGGNGAIALGGGVASAAPLTATFVRTKIAGYGSAGNGTGLSSYGVQTILTMSDCHISGWYYGARPLNGPSGVGVLRSLGNNVFVDNIFNGSFSPVSPL